MDKEKSRRKFLWIYAVVLFASAFAVLLLTAFSQIKLSSNIEEYKTKLNEHESRIKYFDLSLTSAEKERSSLLTKIEALEKENSNLKSVTATGGKIDFNARIKQSNDNLIKADSLYRSDKKVQAAQTLKDILEEDLGEQAKIRYNYLKLQVYQEATKYFFKQAKEQMKINNNIKAKEYFENSLSFDDGKYYEENTLYYLAVLNSKLKDEKALDSAVQRLIANYPKSAYVEKVNKLKLIEK